MEIGFNWEFIYEEHLPGKVNSETHRVKVPGGWLVMIRNFVFTASVMDGAEECKLFDSTVTFVPDKNHEWII